MEELRWLEHGGHWVDDYTSYPLKLERAWHVDKVPLIEDLAIDFLDVCDIEVEDFHTYYVGETGVSVYDNAGALQA